MVGSGWLAPSLDYFLFSHNITFLTAILQPFSVALWALEAGIQAGIQVHMEYIFNVITFVPGYQILFYFSLILIVTSLSFSVYHTVR